MTPRYTRNVEAAKAALAAGFRSAAAQKDATGALSRAYEELRDAIHLPMDADTQSDLYWSIPGDLSQWRDKHAAAVVAAFPALADTCGQVAELVKLRTAIKAAPVVKPETKKAAVERKIAAVKEAVAAGVASPIAMAIAPLRAEASAYALDWATKAVATAKTKLQAAAFDLDVVAPRPDSNASKAQRAMAAEARAFYMGFLASSRVKSGAFEWSEQAAQRFIAAEVSATEQSFDAFVAKLDIKVGAHAAASLVAGTTWSYSILRVTLADGTVQNWKTQRITNCSVLGKLFHQWPTRLVK